MEARRCFYSVPRFLRCLSLAITSVLLLAYKGMWMPIKVTSCEYTGLIWALIIAGCFFRRSAAISGSWPARDDRSSRYFLIDAAAPKTPAAQSPCAGRHSLHRKLRPEETRPEHAQKFS